MRAAVVLAALAVVSIGCKRRAVGGDGGAGGGGGDASMNPMRVLATGERMPQSLAFDATHVYWGTGDGGQVRRIPKAGGTPETLHEFPGRVTAMAVDETHVYFGMLDLGLGASLLRVPKGGGAMEQVCERYWPLELYMDANEIWFATQELIIKKRKAKPGCEEVWDGYYIDDMAVDASHVYWLDSGRLLRRPRDTSVKQPPERLLQGLGRDSQLAVDDTYIYVGADAIFSYLRLPKAGGPVELLAREVIGTDLVLAGDRLLVPHFGDAVDAIATDGGTFVHLTDAVGKEGTGAEPTLLAVEGDTLWVATASNTPPGGIVHLDLSSEAAAAETEKRLAALPPTKYFGRILQLSVRPPGVTLDHIRPAAHRLGSVGFEEGTTTPKADGQHDLGFLQRYDADFLAALRAGRAPITIEAPTDTHIAAAIAYLNEKLPGARYVTRLRSAGKSADLSLTADALATLLAPP